MQAKKGKKKCKKHKLRVMFKVCMEHVELAFTTAKKMQFFNGHMRLASEAMNSHIKMLNFAA